MTTTSTNVVAFPEPGVSVVDAYLRGLPSDATRRVYRRAILYLDDFLGERQLLTATRRDIEGWRVAMEQSGLSASTVAKRMAAVAGFFDFAVDEGDLDTNPAGRARRPKVPTESPRRGTSPAEVQMMIRACDPSTLVGMRDRLILVVLSVQGWRVSELLGLEVGDLDEEGGHRVATIRGKGSKIARVPLAAETWSMIWAWINAAQITEGPIVIPVLKGGRAQVGTPMSSQAADKRIKRIAKQAGITRTIHAHLFRHGAVTTLLDAGVPLRETQDFARHADPRTTRRYDSHRQSLNNPAPHVLAGKLLGS